MSDGMSDGADGIHAARERAQARFGHLSDDDLRRMIERHSEAARSIHATIRELEAMRETHVRTMDDLVTLYFARNR